MELSDTWRWRGSVTICAKLLLRPLCLRAQWRSWILLPSLIKHQPARGRQAHQHALPSGGELVDYDLVHLILLFYPAILTGPWSCC